MFVDETPTKPPHIVSGDKITVQDATQQMPIKIMNKLLTFMGSSLHTQII